MRNKWVTTAAMGLVLTFSLAGAAGALSTSIADRKFDLGGERSEEIQHFSMESRLVSYDLAGTRVGTDVFSLRLSCIPAAIAGEEGDRYTCLSFTIAPEGGPEVSIPALENWTYVFKEEGIDEKGQVFGIDHAMFEGLVDSDGKALPADKAYHVYNAFIDFHAFCNVFAEPVSDGKGIQDLSTIGQKIVHAAAFSEAPINLGSSYSEGSTFQNGEITLELKGLSVANGRECALVAYDSGESSFEMIMRPMPDMEVQVVGSSHYWGDIYKDLLTNWVQKANMTEVVVTETRLPMPPNRVNSVVERHIMLLNVSDEE